MQLYDTPLLDEVWQGQEWARDTTHRWVILCMNFNHRLIGLPFGYIDPDWGWCFESEGLALGALAVWDSDTIDEPELWQKRVTITPGVRRVPLRDPGHPLNRPRCVRGAYLDEAHTDHADYAWCIRERDVSSRGAPA